MPAARWAPAILAATLLLAGCGGDHGKTATTPPRTFDFEADFGSELPATLATGDPVRISGLSVGTVTRVTRSPSGGGVVAMRIRTRHESPASPGIWVVYTDAQVAVRPRIFLEGDWFIDLDPGTGSFAPLGNGDRLPATRTRVSG